MIPVASWRAKKKALHVSAWMMRSCKGLGVSVERDDPFSSDERGRVNTAPDDRATDRATPEGARSRSTLKQRRPTGYHIVVFLLSIGAAILRILLAGRSGLWRDEALAIDVATLSTWSNVVDFLRLHESHPPLYYLLLRAWLTLAGDGDAAALVPSVVCGVALVPAVFVTATRMFSPAAGLVGATLVTASPALALYAAHVRPYSLLSLLCLASLYGLWRALEQGGARWWSVHAAATLAIVLTHNWGWVVLGSQWLVVAVWLAYARPPRRHTVLAWLTTQAIVLALFAPWAPALAVQMHHAGHGGDPTDSIDRTLRLFGEATLGLPLHAPTVAIWSYAASLVGVAAWQCLRRPVPGIADRRLPILLLLGVPVTSLLIVAAAHPWAKLAFVRTFVMLTPAILMALAGGISVLARPGRWLLPGALAAAVAVAYLAQTVALFGELKSNARELARAVAATTHPTDLVVISPEPLAASFNRYFKHSHPPIAFPQLGGPAPTRFDDTRARFGDPDAFRRFRIHLTEVWREGRRTWLIMSQDDLLDVVEHEVLPERMLAGTVGRIRTNQLRAQLEKLYGSPTLTLTPLGERRGDEILTALLFAPRPSRPER